MSVKIFSPESYSGGGGSFFADGKYLIKEARFSMYDFGGSVKDGGMACLCCKLQPLDKDNKPAGEEIAQYWGAGGDVDIKNKGKEIELKGDYETLWLKGDLCLFMDHLGKAGFDRDEYADSEDISILDGLVAEFGKVPPLRDSKEKINPKTGKPYPPTMVPVPVKILKDVVAGKATKGGSKAAAAPEPAADSGGDASEAEDLLVSYLKKEICTDANSKKGIDKTEARMGLRQFAKKAEAESGTVQDAIKLFNTDLSRLLKSLKWELDGTTIQPA